MAKNQNVTTEELLEAFSVVHAMTVTTEQCGKHDSTIIEELCFLSGACRRVINGASF
jgi:predicted molibdopterin-dependent oxidoreductase YjgC